MTKGIRTTTKAQRHINKVMSVLRQGKPVSVLTVTYQTALSETDVEFALATLMEHKIVTATPGGKKYGLVSGYAGKLEVLLNSMKPAPEKPKARAPKPKPKIVDKLTNTDKVLNCLSDGEEWAFSDIVETTGAKTGSVAGLLTTLCKTGQVKKVRRAVYQLPTDDNDEEKHRWGDLPQLVFNLLQDGKTRSPRKIAEEVGGANPSSVSNILKRFVDEGTVERQGRAKYRIKLHLTSQEGLAAQVEDNSTQIAEIKKIMERDISRGILDKGVRLAHGEAFTYVDVMGVEHAAHIEEEDEVPLVVYSEEK